MVAERCPGMASVRTRTPPGRTERRTSEPPSAPWIRVSPGWFCSSGRGTTVIKAFREAEPNLAAIVPAGPAVDVALTWADLPPQAGVGCGLNRAGPVVQPTAPPLWDPAARSCRSPELLGSFRAFCRSRSVNAVGLAGAFLFSHN